MWKCKKCGGKIKGIIAGTIDIDKNGIGIEGTDEDLEIVRYDCDCCRIIKFGNIKVLKRVADWEEEDER